MVRLIPLGGLGEIGLNMMSLEYEGFILVIDAGLMFPDAYMPGADMVIPDIHYLKDNREKVKAIFLTHGHEDHIGAVPFFLREFNIPVFGTSFTIELLKEKLKDEDPKPQFIFSILFILIAIISTVLAIIFSTIGLIVTKISQIVFQLLGALFTAIGKVILWVLDLIIP